MRSIKFDSLWPPTDPGEGFVVTVAIDPFDSTLGLLHNPFYLHVLRIIATRNESTRAKVLS